MVSARAAFNVSYPLTTTMGRVFSAKQLFKLQGAMFASDEPSTAKVTKQDVSNAFGPPPAYSAQTLPDMTATSGKIGADFKKIMTMPFIEYVSAFAIVHIH